jgi:hypothetical protein
MATRKEEDYCKTAFDDYLRHRLGVLDGVWEAEPNGETTAPDFCLRHGGRTYAVEVTTLMTQFQQAAGGRISDQGIWKMTGDLAERAEQEATARGLLRGVYVLTVDGPYDTFPQAKREIQEHLLRFIAETRETDQMEMGLTPFQTSSGQRYFLQKTGTHENLVEITMCGDGGEWDWRVVDELYFLVEDAITSKARKLQGVQVPWVLLLLDRHHGATPKEYVKVRDRLAGDEGKGLPLSRFHSVYIIHGQQQVIPVYLSGNRDRDG